MYYIYFKIKSNILIIFIFLIVDIFKKLSVLKIVDIFVATLAQINLPLLLY